MSRIGLKPITVPSGVTISMTGSTCLVKGPKGELSLEFKSRLENILSIPVYLEDERLTTVTANNVLISGNVSRKNRKKVVDSVAATIILQGYLDRSGRR